MVVRAIGSKWQRHLLPLWPSGHRRPGSCFFGIRSLGRVHGLAATPSSSAIVIIGCSTGIGRSAPLHLAAKGVTVFATVRKEEDAASLRASAGDHSIVPLLCDVSVPDDVIRLRSQVETELKSRPSLQLSGVVNNACILRVDPDDMFDVDILQQVLDVNAIGVYRVSDAFLQLLMQFGSASPGGARVVTESSRASP